MQSTLKSCKVHSLCAGCLSLTFCFGPCTGLSELDKERILTTFLQEPHDWNWFDQECDTTRTLATICKTMVHLIKKKDWQEVCQLFPTETSPAQLNTWVPIFRDYEKSVAAGKRGRKAKQLTLDQIPPKFVEMCNTMLKRLSLTRQPQNKGNCFRIEEEGMTFEVWQADPLNLQLNLVPEPYGKLCLE